MKRIDLPVEGLHCASCAAASFTLRTAHEGKSTVLARIIRLVEQGLPGSGGRRKTAVAGE